MTSTINFDRVFLEKMKLLVTMTNEDHHPHKEFSEEKRQRYIALRKDIAKILTPLFRDLNFCDMFIMHTQDSEGSHLLNPLRLVGQPNSGFMFEPMFDVPRQ